MSSSPIKYHMLISYLFYFKKIFFFLKVVNGFASLNRIVGEIAQKEQHWRYSS